MRSFEISKKALYNLSIGVPSSSLLTKINVSLKSPVMDALNPVRNVTSPVSFLGIRKGPAFRGNWPAAVKARHEERSTENGQVFYQGEKVPRAVILNGKKIDLVTTFRGPEDFRHYLRLSDIAGYKVSKSEALAAMPTNEAAFQEVLVEFGYLKELPKPVEKPTAEETSEEPAAEPTTA